MLNYRLQLLDHFHRRFWPAFCGHCPSPHSLDLEAPFWARRNDRRWETHGLVDHLCFGDAAVAHSAGTWGIATYCCTIKTRSTRVVSCVVFSFCRFRSFVFGCSVNFGRSDLQSELGLQNGKRDMRKTNLFLHLEYHRCSL